MGARVRNLTESTENYLETILLLSRETPGVRVKDISVRMGVSMPSVHVALHVLEDRGMVTHERYGHVELTARGMAAAKRVYASHSALVTFLAGILGVPNAVAERDACRIEHVISAKTMKCIAAFVKSRAAAGEGKHSKQSSGPRKKPRGGKETRTCL
jgi:Mn-dependent DtxR family transcriptional regulator